MRTEPLIKESSFFRVEKWEKSAELSPRKITSKLILTKKPYQKHLPVWHAEQWLSLGWMVNKNSNDREYVIANRYL